ncbi:MAG TPA: type II restriction endonuclease subunit M [Thermoanaerobaculia bacterium]|nr:type II restriction endonuclease subunit M [Thermoanaerobaculia bacterium]
MTVFIRAIEVAADEKPAFLRDAVASIADVQSVSSVVFAVDPEAFSRLPRSPFAYWAGEAGFRCFQNSPRLEANGRHAAAGAQTRDNLRFVRAQWEVAVTEIAPVAFKASSWAPLAKGGPHRRFYADVHLLVRWADDGRELKAATSAWRASKGWGEYWRAAINSAEYYGRPGITWPVRSQKGFSARALGAGAIFGHKGPTVFMEGDKALELSALLALMNSSAFSRLVSLQMAFGAYEVGVIQNTPVPDLEPGRRDHLAELAVKAYRLSRALDAISETSRAFILPAALYSRIVGVDPQLLVGGLSVVQRKIDDLAANAYELPTDSGPPSSGDGLEASSDAGGGESDEDDEDDEYAGYSVPGFDDERTLSSWLVGVSFGRFDPRLATGERTIPPEPGPFDALPIRSPGMYPASEEPADRPDILVDDDGHTDDLAARTKFVAERVKVDAPENLRGWLAREFFPLHIKMYSKSRRKAPIYWQLATPSASYSAWLYIHAFSKDTLFRVQNDYVAPKLAHEERRLELLATELRDDGTAAQRKAFAGQKRFVEELRSFLDEVKRVAPLWNPNLDDGAIINFAPLWRLVPQHKSWQKELTAKWDALCEGKYDWAHLAMHLWPERVVPKCVKDRSLAIAHGLEDVFWVEGSDGKWKARKTPTRSLDDLVRERTSLAVKAALRSLLEAPGTTGNGARARGRRRAAAEGGAA